MSHLLSRVNSLEMQFSFTDWSELLYTTILIPFLWMFVRDLTQFNGARYISDITTLEERLCKFTAKVLTTFNPEGSCISTNSGRRWTSLPKVGIEPFDKAEFALFCFIQWGKINIFLLHTNFLGIPLKTHIAKSNTDEQCRRSDSWQTLTPNRWNTASCQWRHSTYSSIGHLTTYIWWRASLRLNEAGLLIVGQRKQQPDDLHGPPCWYSMSLRRHGIKKKSVMVLP